mgnify:CR=1 FL=1
MKQKHRRCELANFRIDFGMYRGRRLSQVPRDYLDWIIAECHDKTVVWMVNQYIAICRQGDKGHRPLRPSSKTENSQKDDSNRQSSNRPRSIGRRGIATVERLTHGVGEGTR